jgi:hypothetical protein
MNDGISQIMHPCDVRPLSPLAEYALAGLGRCWSDEKRTWSHKYHLDGREPPNESMEHSDLYYSLNVLLGLSKVRAALEKYPAPAELMDHIGRLAPKYKVRNGFWGMALWAAAELSMEPPAFALSRMQELAAEPEPMLRWTAQDIGLTLSGAAACAPTHPRLRPLADKLARVILEQLLGPKGLFLDSPRGLRRLFATFATQVYAALALYHYGELTGYDRAILAANACVSRLIALQGRFGEWPWFYHPATGTVLEPYEVYSVHQHGMGPALLHHAVRHGVPSANEAIRSGFEWLFGRNEMGISMLIPELSLIYRSQRRTGVKGTRAGKLALAANVLLRTDVDGRWVDGGSSLRLTKEMRSYEYGWLLWSFGDAPGYPDLTHRPEFCGNSTAQS